MLAAALLAMIGPTAKAQAQTETILSVLRIGNVVVASTRTGMYQSSESQQKWIAVKLPKGVTTGGCLNVSDPGVTRLYYSPPVKVATEPYDRCAIGFGLWMTADLGKTWKKLDGTHYFRSVLARSDGVLYASAGVPSEKTKVAETMEIFGGVPLVSRDGGKTWTDTTGAEPLPAVMNLSTCAKNAAHVCGGGWSTRLYSMEYAPEEKKWKVRLWFTGETNDRDVTAEEYLSTGGMGSATSPCCFTQKATLGNYYSLGFRDVLQRTGVTLEAEKERYQFKSGSGAKVVVVTVNLLPGVPGPSAMALLDLEETEICWGVRYIDPAGGKHEAAPVITRLNNPALGRAHLVEVGKPYRNTIDLQELVEMRKPGVYRMVLVFDNGKLKKRDENEWTGRIVGTKVFEVEISGQ